MKPNKKAMTNVTIVIILMIILIIIGMVIFFSMAADFNTILKG